MKNNSKAVRVIIYIGLVFWMLVNLFPVYWMFTFSLKSNAEIFGENVIGLPQEWRWSNYATALKLDTIAKVFQAGSIKEFFSNLQAFFKTGNMIKYFLNSTIVAVATIVITLAVALMATFALTRLIWKRRKTLNKFFMLGLTIPIHASIVPVYVTLSRLHLLNTYWALIIPYSAFSLSMAILVCTGFMNEIPRELDESACIDGCSVWGIFFRIIVPLMKPAVATVGIYTFLQCWNELMFANIFISKSALQTLPVGVQALSGQYTTEWGPIGAALVLATFPTLFIYIFLSKKIQESFIAGAVKG